MATAARAPARRPERAAAPKAARVLRVAVVRHGEVLDETHVESDQTVTVGRGTAATLMVADPALPAAVPVIAARPDGGFMLLFAEGMTGRLQQGDVDADLETLRAAARPVGGYFAVPLKSSARGTLSLGEYTVLFQFAQRPRPVVAPELTRPSLRGGVDQLFFLVLGISLFVHLSGATFMFTASPPVERELELTELPDRFARLLAPVKPPEPDKPKDDPKSDDALAKKDAKKADKKKDDAKDPVQRKAEVRRMVANKGLLKQLGALTGKAGGMDDLLGDGAIAADLSTALAGASGVAIATADAVAAGGGPRGGDTGNVAGIGALGTSGGGEVKLAAKADAKVVAKVQDMAPEIESTEVDRDAIARYVKARLKAIQYCYEKELKRNPGLKGKVSVRFTITPSGKTGEIEVEENTVGSEAVGACIRTVIRGWTFPFTPDEDVPVAYPFVFAPAG